MNRRCHLEIMLIEHVRFRFILILDTLQPAVSILELITKQYYKQDRQNQEYQDRIDRTKNTRIGQIEPRILGQDRTKNTRIGQNQEYQNRIEPRILGQNRQNQEYQDRIGQNQEYQDRIESRILGQNRFKNTKIGQNQEYQDKIKPRIKDRIEPKIL